MENFDWTSYKKRIAIKSSLDKVYDAWTKAGELEKWFLKKVLFVGSDSALIKSDKNVQMGDTYEWLWYLYDDPMTGEITSVNGKDFIQFTFEGKTLVDVKLEEDGDYVIVNLRHHNIPSDNESKQYIRLGCTNGWTFYLANLKSVYEGGTDLRNKNEKFGPMINN